MSKGRPTAPTGLDVEPIPHVALRHGQTLRLMTELGVHEGVSTSTFNYYIKSLRKLGVPFEKGKGQSEGRRHVTYDFNELMELTIALLLRVYGTLPDDVVAGIRKFRAELRPIYRRACFELVAENSATARVTATGRTRMTLTGLFLDLNIRYSAGQMVKFGPPKPLSPFEAVIMFARAEVPARSYLPLNVTAVAERIVEGTRVSSPIRRGRSARQARSTPS